MTKTNYSKKYVSDKNNVRRVLNEYLSEAKPTVDEVAKTLGTPRTNVIHILKTHLSEERRDQERRFRISRGRLNGAHPLRGCRPEEHWRYQGDRVELRGYVLRRVASGKDEYVHRLVMAEALGLSNLPEELHVHHIDGNKQNNSLDNLALVTNTGHQEIHRRESPAWATQGSRVSGTSRSQETTPMPLVDS